MIAKRIIVKYRIRYDTLPILKYPFIIGTVKNISGVPCKKKKRNISGGYYAHYQFKDHIIL